jgi:uncharacterized phage protein (TIGR01671 family)
MNNDIQHLDTLNEYLSRDKQVVMQFTGLTDKTGKEVYEGDILSVDKCGVYKKGTATIEWREWFSNENWMMVKAGWFLNTTCKQIWTEKTIKVIGNIYENPELCDDN